MNFSVSRQGIDARLDAVDDLYGDGQVNRSFYYRQCKVIDGARSGAHHAVW